MGLVSDTLTVVIKTKWPYSYYYEVFVVKWNVFVIESFILYYKDHCQYKHNHLMMNIMVTIRDGAKNFSKGDK